MSAPIDFKQFTRNTATVADPLFASKMELAIQLMASAQPKGSENDLEAMAQSLLALKDGIDNLLEAIGFELRYHNASDWTVKTHMQKTCPVLAVLYRIEAMTAHRIANDCTNEAKLAEIRDLCIQAVEERSGADFENPVYPTQPATSKAKRWRRIADETNAS